MTMGMSIEPAPRGRPEYCIQNLRFEFVQGFYSRFLHTITAPAVMATITRSRTISGQLMLITYGREAFAAQLFIHLTRRRASPSRQRFFNLRNPLRMRELPKFERNCISGQKSMEERLPYLLVRILVVSVCVVERAKEFLAALLVFASIRQFGDESAHCILVSNSELVRMSSHDRTSVSEDYTVQGSLPAGTAWVFVITGLRGGFGAKHYVARGLAQIPDDPEPRKNAQ